MRAFRILQDEHKVILSVLVALETMIERIRRDGPWDMEMAVNIIDFLRTFADACHHSKEEVALFRLMRNRGMGAELIDQLEIEHRGGRSCVSKMDRAVREIHGGKTDACHDFADAAVVLIDMLRDHILREDEGLFVMASSGLNSDDVRVLLDNFVEIEKEAGNRRHKDGIALADAICRAAGTPLVPRDSIASFLNQEDE